MVLEVEPLFPELSVLSLLPVLGRCSPHRGRQQAGMGHSPGRGSSRPREALPWLQNPAASSIPGKSQGLCFTPRISNSPKAPEGTPGGNKQHLECWEFP